MECYIGDNGLLRCPSFVVHSQVGLASGYLFKAFFVVPSNSSLFLTQLWAQIHTSLISGHLLTTKSFIFLFFSLLFFLLLITNQKFEFLINKYKFMYITKFNGLKTGAPSTTRHKYANYSSRMGGGVRHCRDKENIGSMCARPVCCVIVIVIVIV